MDSEMLEDFKERQSKMANIQGAMQSGDIKSGCVALPSILSFALMMWFDSLSALLAGDEEPKTSGARAPPTPSGSQQNRNRGNKNKKR